VHQFNRAAVYDLLEECFGWLLFHRDRMIFFVHVMQFAREASCADREASPITVLPRDVFYEIFLHLLVQVDAQERASTCKNSGDTRTHFTGLWALRQEQQRCTLHYVTGSTQDVNTAALNHRCPHVFACYVPECDMNFSSPDLLQEHLRSSCTCYRYPCMACGQILSRGEQETHAISCQFKYAKIMPCAIELALPLCDQFDDPSTEDSLVNSVRRSRIMYLSPLGKVKRTNHSKENTGDELICTDFNLSSEQVQQLRCLSKTKKGYYRSWEGAIPLDELTRRNAMRFVAFNPNLVRSFDGYKR
jgi:hypothetical protein